MSPDHKPSLTLSEVRFGFESRTDFLGPVSLSVAGGECWAIVGPNGAGKSTLLRVMVYLALAKGTFEFKTGVIDVPIGRHKTHRKKMSTRAPAGREAQTRYEVIRQLDGYAYVQLFPKTGRTHQLRVHLASIGHPILGDRLYGGTLGPGLPQIARQALHAHRLVLTHPVTGNLLKLESPLPSDMEALLPAAPDPKSRSLGKYGDVKSKRKMILTELVKTVAKDRPGRRPGKDTDGDGSSDLGPAISGEETQNRWQALSATLTPTLNELTGRKMKYPEEWFQTVKSYKNRLDAIFTN